MEVFKVRLVCQAAKSKKTSKVSLTLGVGQPGAQFFVGPGSITRQQATSHSNT